MDDQTETENGQPQDGQAQGQPLPPPPPPPVYARFVGAAGHDAPGVPARDMTREEWDELPAEAREFAFACGLYALEDSSVLETSIESEGED